MLIKCAACGKKVSEDAVSCPSCGDPIKLKKRQNDHSIGFGPSGSPKRIKVAKKFLTLFFLFLIILWVVVYLFEIPFPGNEEAAKNKQTGEELETSVKQSAEQGNDKAQFKLGMMYVNSEGVPQDYEEAIKWFRLAAEQGNHKAQLRLAIMYAEGQGVTRDMSTFEEARRLSTLAAEGGLPRAQNFLGLLLHAMGQQKYDESIDLMNPDLLAKRMEGDRPEREYYISAHKWLNLGIANTDVRTSSSEINLAKETRNELEAVLEPMDLKEAQRLAKEWSKSHSK